VLATCRSLSTTEALIAFHERVVTAHQPLPKVVVAEGSPVYKGPGMAVELAQAGIETTLIPDCAVFAMMARVNKVPPELCMHMRSYDHSLVHGILPLLSEIIYKFARRRFALLPTAAPWEYPPAKLLEHLACFHISP